MKAPEHSWSRVEASRTDLLERRIENLERSLAAINRAIGEARAAEVERRRIGVFAGNSRHR